jgi:hypothetical protein
VRETHHYRKNHQEFKRRHHVSNRKFKHHNLKRKIKGVVQVVGNLATP